MTRSWWAPCPWHPQLSSSSPNPAPSTRLAVGTQWALGQGRARVAAGLYQLHHCWGCQQLALGRGLGAQFGGAAS